MLPRLEVTHWQCGKSPVQRRTTPKILRCACGWMIRRWRSSTNARRRLTPTVRKSCEKGFMSFGTASTNERKRPPSQEPPLPSPQPARVCTRNRRHKYSTICRPVAQGQLQNGSGLTSALSNDMTHWEQMEVVRRSQIG